MTNVLPAWKRDPFRGGWLVPSAGVIVATILIALRQPGDFTSPRFFAEDGSVWFQQAYNGGLASLANRYNGSFDVVPRIIALVAIHLSLQHAALLDNLAGLAVQVLPVALLLSPRAKNLGTPVFRVAVSAIYALLAVPELNVHVTNLLWHLDLAALVILLSKRPAGNAGKVMDMVILAAAGMTGVVGLLLAPIAIWLYVRERESSLLGAYAGVLTLTAIVQVLALHATLRPSGPLGTSIPLFFQIVANRVVFAGTFDLNTDQTIRVAMFSHPTALAGMLVLVAAGVCVYAFITGPRPLKALLILGAGLLVGGLVSPLASLTLPQWPLLLDAPNAGRYFFTAELCWLVTLVFLVGRLRRPDLQTLGALAVAGSMAYGVATQWPIPALSGPSPSAAQSVLNSAAPGTEVTIEIAPVGWSMQLVKR